MTEDELDERSKALLLALEEQAFDRLEDAMLAIDNLRGAARGLPLPDELERTYASLRSDWERVKSAAPARRVTRAPATPAAPAGPPDIDRETGPRVFAAYEAGAMTLEAAFAEIDRVMFATRRPLEIPAKLMVLRPPPAEVAPPKPKPPPPLPSPTADERRVDRAEAQRIEVLDRHGFELRRKSRDAWTAVSGVRFEQLFAFDLLSERDIERAVQTLEGFGEWLGASDFAFVDNVSVPGLSPTKPGTWSATLRRLRRAGSGTPGAALAYLMGGPSAEGVPHRALQTQLHLALEPGGSASTVRITSPWEGLDATDVRERFLGACRELAVSFAVAGPRLCVSEWLALNPRESLSRRLFPLLMRHPALGHPIPRQESYASIPELPGWLTCISSERAKRLGASLEAIEAHGAGPMPSLHRLPDGVTIQTSALPDLGEPSVLPEPLAHVARMLGPFASTSIPHDGLPGIPTEVLRGLVARLFPG